jgi:hypothetical protein
LLLVRNYLACLEVVLGTVLLGLLVAPGHALDGRLSGVLWDIPATQVAHYAAIVFGLTIVLWFCGEKSGGVTLLVCLVSAAMLVLTHTRTALIGMIVAVIVSGLSLIAGNSQVRKVFAIMGITAAAAISGFSHYVIHWLARGEGTQELTQLTGRTKVWGPLLALPRDKFQEIFGFGLSNSSFNGLPIDSNWLSSYLEQGVYGVVVCALMLLFLLLAAYFQPRSTQRALALFLITYCLIASFTEDGFTDATPYLLELALAASLLVPAIGGDVPQ